MDLCVCDAQLQPHDRLPNVCPEPLVEDDPWLDLGGEG